MKMNIIHKILKFINYCPYENGNSSEVLDEQFTTEEEYKSRLIWGHFTKDGLILIISNIIILGIILIMVFSTILKENY